MSTDNGGAMTPMPRYRAHQLVWALQIKEVERHPLGGATLTPVESGYAPFTVDEAYMRKHDPRPGGYFVEYETGYKSFSPASVFEASYAKITPAWSDGGAAARIVERVLSTLGVNVGERDQLEDAVRDELRASSPAN